MKTIRAARPFPARSGRRGADARPTAKRARTVAGSERNNKNGGYDEQAGWRRAGAFPARLYLRAASFAGHHQLHGPLGARRRCAERARRVQAVAGADGLPVLVLPVDLRRLHSAGRHPARSLFRAQHQFDRHRTVVDGHGGDRSGRHLPRPVRHAAGHGSGRGHLDPVLRPDRAGMDAGQGARPRQRVLERRQLRRPRPRRDNHRLGRQRLRLARRLRRPWCARLGLACLQSRLVRPARTHQVAHRGRAPQDPGRGLRRRRRRNRHSRQPLSGPGIVAVTVDVGAQ